MRETLAQTKRILGASRVLTGCSQGAWFAVLRNVISELPLDERISRLKRLHAAWTADYNQVVTFDPARAAYIADALADLQLLLRSFAAFESWSRSTPPRYKYIA